jgi:hypothetical protein
VGNLWYVDPQNALEVQLTKASGYSSVGITYTYLSTYSTFDYLAGIVIDAAGNHWVSDYSCTGAIFENQVPVFSAGDSVWALQISTLNPTHKAHLYITISDYCGNYPYPFVADASSLHILPSPYVGYDIIDYMYGISTTLYFTDYTYDRVWVTVDTGL